MGAPVPPLIPIPQPYDAEKYIDRDVEREIKNRFDSGKLVIAIVVSTAILGLLTGILIHVAIAFLFAFTFPLLGILVWCFCYELAEQNCEAKIVHLRRLKYHEEQLDKAIDEDNVSTELLREIDEFSD